MEDNAAVITVATEESAMMKRCKHFLMVVNFVKQYVLQHYIEIRKIHGPDNTSDMLTKPLVGAGYDTKSRRLMNDAPALHYYCHSEHYRA